MCQRETVTRSRGQDASHQTGDEVGSFNAAAGIWNPGSHAPERPATQAQKSMTLPLNRRKSILHGLLAISLIREDRTPVSLLRELKGLVAQGV